jgi:hypothetical protein
MNTYYQYIYLKICFFFSGELVIGGLDLAPSGLIDAL